MQIKLPKADAIQLTQGHDAGGYTFVESTTDNDLKQTVILAADGIHYALFSSQDEFLGSGGEDEAEAVEFHKKDEY
ncbi:hypothetical protein [Levilactobacillus humaensis]|uniref:hypothetical protein n=1 Tax=Levilactobacillus humaensis TaxID=2950375 RepID=UPI0021C3360E|nr:hypothetical protein [Levilactobacillus humaensis]